MNDSIKRQTRSSPQLSLIEVEPSWREYWWGMPSFVMVDARPMYRITVNIYTLDDLKAFGEAIGQNVTTETASIAFPRRELFKRSEWEYADE